MLRRAKSVDIPFMVKGYEIGLRDGNFSESKMQINAFFANTTTHKNVHSYVYEQNGAVAGFAILRKKDATRHEIMMMFVDPAQQGNGIGKRFFGALLSGPMKDSPVLCSTTQPASTRMMALLKANGFQRKIEAADGVYWEKPNGPGAAVAPAPAAAAPAKAPPLSGMAPPPRLAAPMPILLPPTEYGAETVALEQATQVSQRIPKGYRPAPPPVIQPPPSPIIDGIATEVATEPAEEVALDATAPTTESGPISPTPPPTEPEEKPAPVAEPAAAALPVITEAEAPPAPQPPAPEGQVKAQTTAPSLPKPPVDFSGKANLLGFESRQQRAKQLAKELFETLKAAEPEPDAKPVLETAVEEALESDAPSNLPSSEEDIPLLATLNVVREKMGSLPGVKLPPIDRYSLMEFNKKDLENMNVVELAALSAQLIKLARDQLEEIDRLKVASKKRR